MKIRTTKQLQQLFFVLLSGGLFLSACNNPKSTSAAQTDTSILPDSPKSTCTAQVLYMFITKNELERYTDSGNFNRLYLQFRTSDGIKFYGDSYGWFGGPDYVKHFITPLDIPEDINTSSYVFGNLELRKGELKKIPGAVLYVFKPFIDNTNAETINYVNYEIMGYTHNDLSMADSALAQKALTDDTVTQLIPILVSQALGTSAGITNPCPPKTP